MKKQILILVIAIFAISMSTVYGQKALPGFAPVPLTCPTNDPLNPIAGRAYDYSAVINPALGSTFWYATKSTSFVNAGVRVATEIPDDGVAIASGATNYRTSVIGATATSPTATQVTWTSAGLNGVTNANPLFMVVEYQGPACANNMKVMKIVPKIAFTVDVANMENVSGTTLAYTGVTEDQCYSNVASSSYNFGTSQIDIDYGINYLYFEVIAANFTGSFTPTLQLTGITGTQTADIDWGIAKGTYDQSLVIGAASAATITGGPITVSTDETNTATGVSIYVKVTVHNNGFEGTADQNISLAVEAIDAFNNPDVDPVTCSVPSTPYEDIAMQTLNARPSVITTPASVPQKP